MQTSATNILNNIKDLCDAALKIAAEIIKKCTTRKQNCYAAQIEIEDLTRRIKCFIEVLLSVSIFADGKLRKEIQSLNRNVTSLGVI